MEMGEEQKRRKKKKAGSLLRFLLIILIISCGFFVLVIKPEILIGARNWGELFVDSSFDFVAERLTDIHGDSVKETGEGAIRADVSSVSSVNKIAYKRLTEEEQTVYKELLAGIEKQKERIYVSSRERETIEKAYDALIADHGEIFWVFGYSYRTYSLAGETISISFEPTYTKTLQERKELQKKLDDEVEKWLTEPHGDTEYEISKFIYDSIVRKTDYVPGSADNQNVLSVFLGHQSVCQGYANAAELLFHKMDIPCVVVTGTARGQSHAWNIVKLDGHFYHFDATWGSGRFRDEGEAESERLDYAFLNVTDDEISTTHDMDVKFAVPEADGTEDNYFRKEGLYFSKFNGKKIGKIFSAARLAQEREVSVRLGNAGEFEKAKKYFFDDGNIQYYIVGLTRYRYLLDDKNQIITVLL